MAACGDVVQYNKASGSGLVPEELRALLSDLGMLDALRPGEVDAYVTQQFSAADTDLDGFISPSEFHTYYKGLGLSDARHKLRSRLGLQVESEFRLPPGSIC